MRLLSYNIHKGIGGRDRRYRLERVIRVIEEENPDLICLQEVDRHVRRTRHDDQPRKLTEAFHAAAHLFQLNVRHKSGGYGNLVLSRWPIHRHHQVSLRLKRRKPRGAQMAVVETPEGPIHLVHWHLGLAERERHWQVRHLLEHAMFGESAHLPTLDRRRLQRLAQYAGKGAVLATWLRAGDHAALPVPLIPGLSAGRLARQSLRPWPGGSQARPDRPLAAGTRCLRPLAAGRRFPPESSCRTVISRSPQQPGDRRVGVNHRGEPVTDKPVPAFRKNNASGSCADPRERLEYATHERCRVLTRQSR